LIESGFLLEPLGPAHVQGKGEALEVFNVLGRTDAGSGKAYPTAPE
jgi:hypothetical protein